MAEKVVRPWPDRRLRPCNTTYTNLQPVDRFQRRSVYINSSSLLIHE